MSYRATQPQPEPEPEQEPEPEKTWPSVDLVEPEKSKGWLPDPTPKGDNEDHQDHHDNIRFFASREELELGFDSNNESNTKAFVLLKQT